MKILKKIKLLIFAFAVLSISLSSCTEILKALETTSTQQNTNTNTDTNGGKKTNDGSSSGTSGGKTVK